MGKVKISWTTTTTERFDIEVEASELPDDWRVRLDRGTISASQFLADYEWEHDHSTALDETVESRQAVYQVFDEADYGVLEQALQTSHLPTYVQSVTYPDLVTLLCSCGQSSFGASPRTTAEALHAQHAANPSAGLLRDRATTEQLLSRIRPERKASS